uniref:Uncharacterized protein n=2 Tax=Paenibacillus athensensis TaxID=1967502 RepID=A0A4Y8Q4J8_9BACL
MKMAFFLAHDPGGADVVLPAADWFKQHGLPAVVYCVGPAALLHKQFAAKEAEVIRSLEATVLAGESSLIVTGTSWNSDFEIQCLNYCNQHGVPTATILDYWTNYKLRCTDTGGSEVFPQYYIVMDELASQEAISDGVPGNIIRILGHPGLDRFVKAKPVNRQRRGSESKKALFLSQPLSQLYGTSLGYNEESVIPDLLKLFQLYLGWDLFIKFHPKDKPQLRSDYRRYAVNGDLTEWLSEVDLVIGMNSIGLLHAYLLNKPVISYQPNLQKEDFCITNKLKLTRSINSYNELAASFETLAKGIRNEIGHIQQPIWMDGRSTARIGMFLKEIRL